MLSLAKGSGRELFQSPNWRTSPRGHGEHHTIYCRQNMAELCPDYAFDYSRAKYFPSTTDREIQNLKPILCNSISQKFSKEKVTVPGEFWRTFYLATILLSFSICVWYFSPLLINRVILINKRSWPLKTVCLALLFSFWSHNLPFMTSLSFHCNQQWCFKLEIEVKEEFTRAEGLSRNKDPINM